jgi:hypothetical protein
MYESIKLMKGAVSALATFDGCCIQRNRRNEVIKVQRGNYMPGMTLETECVTCANNTLAEDSKICSRCLSAPARFNYRCKV